MSLYLRLFTKAIYQLDHVVRTVESGQWDIPSNCEGWTVRDILGHVVALQEIRETRIAGDVPDINPFDEPRQFAAGDPYAVWTTVRDRVLTTIDRQGVLAQPLTMPDGSTLTVDEAIGRNVGDTLIHAWDIARSTGGDERLAPALVEFTLQALEPIADQMRNPMVFGPRVEIDDAADSQARLLALTGRTP